MDWFEHIAISVLLSALRQAIKNPTKAEHLKEYMLEIRDRIDALWPREAGA